MLPEDLLEVLLPEFVAERDTEVLPVVLVLLVEETLLRLPVVAELLLTLLLEDEDIVVELRETEPELPDILFSLSRALLPLTLLPEVPLRETDDLATWLPLLVLTLVPVSLLWRLLFEDDLTVRLRLPQ